MAGVLDRLGILTDEVSDDFGDALDWAAGQGLKHVEARVINGKNVVTLDDDQVRDVRRQGEARGLHGSAMPSPLFKCAPDPSRGVASGDRYGRQEGGDKAACDKLDRAATTARLPDTRRVRIFSFWREKDPAAHRDEVARHLKRAASVA